MATKQNEICAPMEALAIEGAQPREGDQVAVELQGTLDRTEDGLAYITAQRVNGQPVPETKPADGSGERWKNQRKPEGELPSEEDLLSEARALDERGY